MFCEYPMMFKKLACFAGLVLPLWLGSGCGERDQCSGSDLNHNTKVNLRDYALLTPNILPPVHPPPYTDYCAMLSQEVQGKKHGFMAGNLTYYIGGHYAVWKSNMVRWGMDSLSQCAPAVFTMRLAMP